MIIIADPNIPFVREAFRQLGDVQLVPGRQINAESVRNADVLLVRSITPVHEGLLGATRVKFVATATIGTDHVDEAWLKARRIGFASAAGSNANSVAEYVVAALLALGRRKKIRLRDRTIGIVGVGNVGRRVSRYAQALGMRVLLNDPPRQRAEPTGPDTFVSLDQVLREADIITTHVPMTREGVDKTFHLIDPQRLRSSQVFINTARGAVIDNAALLEVVTRQPLTGLVLDVWENEPHLLRPLLDRVDIGTHHIAGYSFDGKVNGVRMIHAAACRHFGVVSDWTPEMPEPPVPRVDVTVEDGADDEEILRRVVSRVYDIEADDRSLREKASEFDWLRAHYPERREFVHTAVAFQGGSDEVRRKAAALRFQVLS
jgi:erythronate-4-phosphate dehydrogenase